MKNLKQKLRDLCWYKICYADLLKNKDKDKYANIMADDILELLKVDEDLTSVITFLEGDVAREKIVNYIKKYLLKQNLTK